MKNHHDQFQGVNLNSVKVFDPSLLMRPPIRFANSNDDDTVD
jgi:hypothetical protein